MLASIEKLKGKKGRKLPKKTINASNSSRPFKKEN
jgi:hypothetical protein